MNIREYVERAKQIEPRLVNLHDQRDFLLLRKVFEQISWQLQETPEGVVNIPFFGRFISRQVKIQKDGREEVVTRIIFKPASEDVPGKA
ncbi:MAG: hypothetical protein HQL21_03280 [Candidatus Omnitrophica bacterium]|nr:hypothetical protein [Candidatus Omnitrophota bacterium]